MHRSGTTWAGQIAAHAMPDAVLHEPLNANTGLRGVDKWYYGPDEGDYVASLLRDMLAGRLNFRRRRGTDTWAKNLVRSISGSRYERQLRAALSGDNSAIILKDPFLIRLGTMMAETFDAKGVILKRHPAALINSLNRMGWILPDTNGKLIETYSPDPETQFAFQIGRFWAALYAEVDEQAKARPDMILIIRHEDLCEEPIALGERMLAHLDLPLNQAATDFLTTSTSGKIGEESGSQLFSMHRDARALAHSWRNKLSPEIIEAVQTGGGDVLRRAYPE
ncbi:hypothetical protein CEW88_23465 (plasmid) [Alloyangia pacifica]|uniref:Sulfotransferase family protein n=2 Tax=Alloyangia pacifica TaxID=311180 RepID=A0A2U8HLG6_9RHOB|nr:hypothetical protein CEW88_23465 [Alloyangia pacifica]